MRALPFLLTFIACTVQADTPKQPACITVPVASVYDGDTMTVELSLIAVGEKSATLVSRNAKVDRWPVRIRGYDTPEMRGSCPESKALAKQARDHVRALVADAGGRVTLCGLEFAGAARDRIVASVRVDGLALERVMPRLGLARVHEGSEARRSWCPEADE
jgi:endonuclease YncB( thermonuclease family)